ncbi:lysophospholipase [Colletotrichum tofieldiae]|nr:lysophospholipase [Colletotrichum tofieldiae]
MAFEPTAERLLPASNYPESRVLIIMTGGTICMQPTADGLQPIGGFLKNAMAPRPSFNDKSSPPVQLEAIKDGQKVVLDSLRTPPSAYSRHIRYGVLEFNPLLDSSSISAEGWTEIAQTIRENYRLFDGFVVLHGTDSLSYTASALSFMLSDLGKPVILTGSQASIFALQSDAVDNLLGSLIIAGTFVIPEVGLFFHHKLFRGNRTSKVSSAAFEAFASPNCEPLAKVNGLGIDVNWPIVLRPTRIAELQVTNHLDTAHVACLRVFPGIRPEMLDSVLRVPDLRGLILETFGMGNAPSGIDGSLTKVIKAAVDRGVIVVNVSQCMSGFAALTKLSYLLAIPNLSTAEVSARMSQSLRGEMTEMALPVFSHPSGSLDSVVARLTASESAFTVLGYAIRNGDVRTVKEILDNDGQRELLKMADYAGNTAVHLAAVGPDIEILRELLTRGASVHARNRANNTPLYLAEKTGKEGCVHLLKETGAHLWQEEEAILGSVHASASASGGVQK